jgi:hypothetical protein
MYALFCRFLFVGLLLLISAPSFAQKTTQPQPLAAPGESTEPPHPKAAPVPVVQLLELPRGGGVAVFGDADGTSLELAKQLVADHVQVTVVGAEANPKAAALGAAVTKADLAQPDALKPIFTSTPLRAVVSILGNGEDLRDNKVIVDAMTAAGVPRLVVVSAIGAGDSVGALPWYLRLAAMVGYKDLDDKSEVEDYVRNSKLTYTIIRAGRVSDGPPGGTAALTSDATAYGGISRADLVKLVAASVDDDTLSGKTLSALDQEK